MEVRGPAELKQVAAHCPPDEILQQLLDEALAPTIYLKVEQHVETCDLCRGRLDRLTAHSAWDWLCDAPPADGARSAAALPPGWLDSIPDYRIVAKLGHGAHGVVYRARQTRLNRDVALKVLRFAEYASREQQIRLLREAEAAALLQHPNLVHVYSVGEHLGVPFFTMELVDGANLAKMLGGAPQPARYSADLVKTLAGAIQEAHAHGIIHRDLKPSNILLTGSGSPKISDFGVAKIVASEDGPTLTHAILGTPSYIAPEQAAGGSKAVTPATDVYSLGAILYELLTGRPPFRSPFPFETLLAVRDHDPVPPRQFSPKIPRDLETICLKCLRKDPRHRYPTAAALADDLGRFLKGEPILARPATLRDRLVRQIKRRPTAAALTAVAALAFVVAGAGLAWHRIELLRTKSEAQTETLLESLTSLETARVPEVVAALVDHHERVLPTLRQMFAAAPPGSKTRLHVSLALLPKDPAQIDFLYDYALSASLDELTAISTALEPFRERIVPQLWSALCSAKAEPHRIRPACLLAGFDPDSLHWRREAENIVDELLNENPLLLSGWVRFLQPVRAVLTEPLARAFVDPARGSSERFLAASLVRAFAADRVELLANLAVRADADQYAMLLPLLLDHRDDAVAALVNMGLNPPHNPRSAAEKERLAKTTALAAITLLHLGRPDEAWSLCRHSKDPTIRTYLVHWLALGKVDPRVILDRIETESDPSARRALILALGEYEPSAIPLEARRISTLRLLNAYRVDPDPGIHAAIDWLLRQRWGEAAALDAIERELTGKRNDGRWYVNSIGDTMVVIEGPTAFMMGSPSDETEQDVNEAHRVRKIEHTFSVAAREVDWQQFEQFCAEVDGQHWLHPKYIGKMQPRSTVPCVSWFTAARYCRWLSERERIPEDQMVYPPIDQIKPGMRISLGNLSRSGYRLPTEKEWEYACRAGAATVYSFGTSEEFLAKYAWYLQNARGTGTQGGLLKPNDFGLFDMHGNFWEWCQPTLENFGTRDAPPPVDPTQSIVMDIARDGYARGGSYLYHSAFTRCAKRYGARIDRTDVTISFRIGRTEPTR